MKVQRAPILLFTFGLRKGDKHKILGKQCVIGRDSMAEVQLDSPYVSRKHAEVVFEAGYWFITDFFSKNGVFINMKRIEPGKPFPLKDHDQVQIGSVSSFEFKDPEATVYESKLRIMQPGLWLDESNHNVFVFGERLEPPLSNQQFALLTGLVNKNGDVISNEEIAAMLWPESNGSLETTAVDNIISRLRSRLRELDETHDYIETVRGVGYRMRVP